MKNNNTLNKQTGAISKLMLLVIISAVGYGAYFANKKGLITTDSISSMKTRVSSAFSDADINSAYTGYGIQLMATQQLGHATTVMNDFARDGYSAFVVASKAKDHTIYKVRLGPYSHKPEAVAIKDKVIRRYPNNPYVKSSIVIYKP